MSLVYQIIKNGKGVFYVEYKDRDSETWVRAREYKQVGSRGYELEIRFRDVEAAREWAFEHKATNSFEVVEVIT